MALTVSYLNSIQATGKRFEKADRDGMSIRVSAKGQITFQAAPSIYGKRVRISYGDYPAMSLKQAREKHKEALELIEQEIDPRDHWASQVEEKRTAVTVKELCQEWYERYALKNRKCPEDAKRSLEVDVYPLIGKRKAKDIKRRDVIRIANEILERGSKAQAHRTLALVKQIFSYGVQAGLLEFSPATEIKPAAITGKGKARERILTDDEIKVVWHTLPDLGLSIPVELALKLLLVTAQRRGELASARWEHINLEGDSPLWSIPADNSKNGKAHEVPLSPLAVKLFRELKEYGEIVGPSAWLMPSIKPEKPMTDKSITRAVARKQEAFTIDDKPIPHWTPHDLRRTATTKLAELNTPPYVVEKILNHSLEGVMAIYNRYDYMPERREALKRWGERLELLVADHQNVVLMQRVG